MSIVVILTAIIIALFFGGMMMLSLNRAIEKENRLLRQNIEHLYATYRLLRTINEGYEKENVT
jgi:hypothetical protein